MPRYKLTIEYDGAPYCGWQRQANGPSVQAALEGALLGCTQETVTVRAAGRTDAGVHALGQVAHVDLGKDWPVDTLRDAVNAHLKGETVAVLSAECVDDSFDARFSAVKRHYLYRVINRRPPLCIEAGRAWRVPRPLDASAMHDAARELIGHHDFTTFRSSECQSRSPVKTLDRLDVTRCGERIDLAVSARSFLHNQVRSLAGTLVKVGDGSWSRADVARALSARDRTACGPVAPAHGLYLMRVDYSTSIQDQVLDANKHTQIEHEAEHDQAKRG